MFRKELFWIFLENSWLKKGQKLGVFLVIFGNLPNFQLCFVPKCSKFSVFPKFEPKCGSNLPILAKNEFLRPKYGQIKKIGENHFKKGIFAVWADFRQGCKTPKSFSFTLVGHFA